MLDKQISLFKVDTKAFFSEREKDLDRIVAPSRHDKYRQEYLIKLLKKKQTIFKRLLKKNPTERNKHLYEGYTKLIELREEKLSEINEEYNKAKDIYKEQLLEMAKETVEYNIKNPKNVIIRDLDEKQIFRENGEPLLKNVVSMFESTLTRSFNIKTNELTTDIFIVDIYYFDIAKDLIINGFNYNNKHYVYFSSSAGQIRTKKAVFVEETKYEKCINKLMCGLTIDSINAQGGMNINKFLAYLALSNSATETWETVFGKKFDIDRCIVVSDFETLVRCKVDYIDYQTYEIEPNVIKDMPIPHTDGCGMVSKEYSNKNFMIRLPWIKGLLGSFDFRRFAKENNCTKVKDAWGKEWDIFEDDIHVIFTESQLKMKKYYSSWEEYKQYFKQFNCEAGICNMEEDKIPNAKINYQMLQTLYNMTDKEVKEICKYPNKKIKEICSSLENMLSFFGVGEGKNEENYNYFQKALKIYPELINEPSNKENLRDLKNSLVKKYRGGKLDVFGKFTFVLPDLYAFCEWLFLGVEVPLGLLKNQEVYCRLYRNRKELDCLRSPSLYIEHAIRENVCGKKYRNQYLDEWYDTDAIYTSTYDLISKILQ